MTARKIIDTLQRQNEVVFTKVYQCWSSPVIIQVELVHSNKKNMRVDHGV